MEAAVQAFLSSLESSQPCYSKNTRLAYRSDLIYFLDHLHKAHQRIPDLADFNAQNVAAFLEGERQNGRRLGTLLRRRATLRRFELFLVREGLLPSGPLGHYAELIDQPLAGLPHKGPVLCLSGDQVQVLLSCLSESQRTLARRDHALLAVLLETGLSVSMLAAVNLTDLDLRAGKIHIGAPDGQDIWLPLGSAVESTGVYLKEGRPELCRSVDEPALFISQVGTRMSRQSIWQVLRHWGEVARLPVLLSPRLVRHTAALRLFQNGRPIQEIQALLGHSNPLSTQALLHRLETTCVSG
jgi:integrase/recombinase XerD